MTHSTALKQFAGAVVCLAIVGRMSPLQSQEALVLSAGGSRGLAHVGVLMALDSLQRDPDLVVGTSMGAVVGALYAAGYSSADIRRLVTSQNWDDLFKEIPLPLGADRAVHVPMWRWAVELKAREFSPGLKPDWRVNRMLVRLLADAEIRARGDFDQLPRRFRAVTTDFRTGEEVVLDHGNLARAARASLGMPGFFSPILWEKRVLTEGGISDYLPVSVARQLGARTVIAVDVMRPKREFERKDALGLAFRGLGLVTVNAHSKSAAPDILIYPDVSEDLDGLVFPDNLMPLIESGLRAALDSVPRHQRGSRRATRRRPRAPDSLSKLLIETPEPAIAALAGRIFRRATPARYDIESLLDAADRLYASGVANGVWLRVDAARDVAARDSTYPRHAGNQNAVSNGEVSRSSPTLIVTADPSPRVEASVAAGYDNDRGGRVWGAVAGRLPAARAPTAMELAASTNGLAHWGALSMSRHSLIAAPLRWTAGAHVADIRAPFFPLGADVTDPHVRRGGGWLGLELPNIYPDWLLSAAFRGEQIGVRANTASRGVSYGPYVRFTIPTADVYAGPTAIELETRFGEIAYRRASARGLLPLLRGTTQVAAAIDVAVVSGDATPDVVPSLGDNRAMPGYRWGEARGRSRIVSGFDVSRSLLPMQGKARLRLRAGTTADNTDDLGLSRNWVTGAEVGGTWSLPLASLFVGVGANSRGRQRLDVSIGPRF